MKKVSIIIPAYNVEKYIQRAIQSALGQTLDDVEVIVVDDGSTDNTYQICSEYGDRIKLIHKDNGGLSSARNQGMEQATGEYIGFLDGDDYADPQMFEVLYLLAKKYESDVIFCTCKYIREEDIPDEIIAANVEIDKLNRTIIEGDELRYYISNANVNKNLWFVWRGLYKKFFLNEHSISFLENIRFGEDSPFILECLLCARRIVNIDAKLYYYVQRNGSLTKTAYRSDYFDKLNQIYLVKKRIYDKYHFLGYEEDLNQYTMMHTLPMLLANEICNKKNRIERIRTFKKMRESEMISKAFEMCSTNKIHSRIRFAAILMKYKVYVLMSILCR